MVQETFVVPLPPGAAPGLKQRLVEGRFDFRSVPHALFSAKGEGVVATFYASGKLVVQGAGAQLFLDRYVAGARPSPSAAPKPHADHPATLQRTMVGSDECGKGDYFGPLVVCAVRLAPDLRRELAGGQIRDSKTLGDATCLRLGAALRSRLPHAIARLDPPQYNATWAKLRNVNEVLADLHEKAIRKLAHPGDHVLVDKFANEHLLQRRLADLDIHLEQRVRAESELAVAAASIIAREEFLTALATLSEEVAVDLHKGAGDPVDRSLRRYVDLHGHANLARVAKVHFKNTQRVPNPDA
jgi:ribonuclease HIII